MVSVIDGEYSSPNSPGFIHKQMQSLEQARPGNLLPSVYQGAPITDTQVFIFITSLENMLIMLFQSVFHRNLYSHKA
jgi:hypothetical protein